jgi:predicted transcriptional regulator
MAQSTDPRVALLSIHPEFARGIFDGTKRVEFRRRSFAKPVTHIIVYSTAPDSRVLGYFAVDGVEAASPATLWRRHGKVGLISREKFSLYFAGVDKGYAIRVGEVVTFDAPRALHEATGHGTPPQSFAYVDSGKARRLISAF